MANKNSAGFWASSKNRNRWTFVVIIVLTVAAVVISGSNYYNQSSAYLADKTNQLIKLPVVKDVPFRLGLDLQGGTQLVYQADMSNISESERASALEGVRDVIERRVNVFGVAEPQITANKTVSGDYRIIAELAGIKDVKDAIAMIGETPILEFKEQGTPLTEAEQQSIITETNAGSAKQAQDILSELYKTGDFSALAEKYNGQSLGWIDESSQPEIFKALRYFKSGQFFGKVLENDNSYNVVKLDNKKTEAGYEMLEVTSISFPKISIDDLAASVDENNWQNTELTGRHLKRASVTFDPNDGAAQVSLEFNDEGAQLFEDVTARNIGKPVAIFLDGLPISVPNVNEKISGGKAVINGTFSATEAKLLAQRLNTGALPVPIDLVSQQTVGATLGQESIHNSIFAGLIGLIVVALFMIAFYRFPGLLAVGALFVYGVLTLAIFKLWPVTLTLSGIAGFILSVGMAVDANILIFERMKEELKDGKSLDKATEDGFNRAWPSIRDSNFTTLIVCMVLVQFSSSSVKGFAVTLALGVIISMFTAIFVTRNFLRLIGNRFLEKRPALFLGAINKR